jgi:A/G-specific adenine glycosylase
MGKPTASRQAFNDSAKKPANAVRALGAGYRAHRAEYRAHRAEYHDAIARLAAWFEKNQRILPWREDPSPYRVWISEIMLQQTQVVTVLPYFERFMTKFPSVETLAHASEDEVMLHWAGLGYYSRARNLHKGAKKIVEEGRFPSTREEWLEIPGVGPYTAGAISSIALEQPEAILDGNVERVFSRVYRVARNEMSPTEYKEALWQHSGDWVTHSAKDGVSPRVSNQALMELGATFCSPRQPKCLLCPLFQICEARIAGEVEKFPTKKKAKAWIEKTERLLCLIDAKGAVLVDQRKKGEWRQGLWDLPREWPPAISRKSWEKEGEVETKHVVTNHRILRVTEVWKPASALVKTQWKASESKSFAPESAACWVLPDQPTVALGSAVKKTLLQIRERFPEALPRS